MKKSMTLLMALVMLVAMMLPVSAAKSDFVPSAEVKPAPGIVEKPTEDGTPAVGEIIMPDGTVIPVPGTEIIITPLAGADEAKKPSTTEELKDAYDSIKNAEDLEDVADLDDLIKDGVDPDDLVISDMFHVDLDEYKDKLDEGGEFEITFEVDGDVVGVLVYIDGKWTVLPKDKFTDNGDGTYTLKLSQSCVVAFVKNAGSVDVDPEKPGVSSPTTGDMSVMYILMGSALLLAAAFFALAAKKQKA